MGFLSRLTEIPRTQTAAVSVGMQLRLALGVFAPIVSQSVWACSVFSGLMSFCLSASRLMVSNGQRRQLLLELKRGMGERKTFVEMGERVVKGVIR